MLVQGWPSWHKYFKAFETMPPFPFCFLGLYTFACLTFLCLKLFSGSLKWMSTPSDERLQTV